MPHNVQRSDQDLFSYFEKCDAHDNVFHLMTNIRTFSIHDRHSSIFPSAVDANKVDVQAATSGPALICQRYSIHKDLPIRFIPPQTKPAWTRIQNVYD